MSKTRLVIRDETERFWEAEVKGSSVSFGEGKLGGDATVTTETFDSEEAAAEAVEAAAKERREKGWLPAFEQDSVIADYYGTRFLKELIDDHELTKKETSSENAALFARYHGESLPPELMQFLRMRDDYGFVYQSLGEWRIWGEDPWLPDPAKGNLAEQIIRLDQANYLGTCLVEYFAGCIFIGTAGNGDSYFACIHPRPDNAEVGFWNHETHDMEFFIADSLSSLAYANHLLEKVQRGEEDEEMDLSDIAEEVARIAERTNLSWHYGSLEEVGELETSYEGTQVARYYYYRALWLINLLRNDGVHKVSSIPEVFGIIDQGRFQVEQALDGPHLATTPVTAFYWLWRLFFFNKDEQLRKALAVAKGSDNPVIRDLAVLVEELQDGRKELGTIDDIHALRDKFIALDLDPDRAEEREREQKEAEAAAVAKKNEDEKAAQELIAGHSPDELTELAWKHVGNQTIIDAIYKHLRESDPSLAGDFVRLDFVLEGKYNRDNRSFSEELDETLEALTDTGSRRLIPFLLTSGRREFVEMVGRMGEAKAIPHIRPRLSQREEYHHELQSTVAALASLGVADAVPELIPMLDEFAYEKGDFMSAISNKHILWTVCEALGELGDTKAVAPLCKVVESGNKDLVARAIVSLGRLGHADAVDCLLEQLGGTYGRPAMFALARIGDARAIEPIARLVERRRGCLERLVYERVMLDALRAACGEPARLDAARFALQVVEASKYEAVELHDTAIRLLADHGERDEVVKLVTPFLDAEQYRIRRAAIEALARHGVNAAPRYYDRGTVDALYEERSVDGLREALLDADGIVKHNLVRKAVDEECGGEIEKEIVAYGRQLLRFEHYSYTFVRDEWPRLGYGIKAVAAIGTEATDRFAYDAITHPNVMVQKVFQYHHDELKERLGEFGPLETRPPALRAGGAKRKLEVSPFGCAPWTVGAMVNGLAFTPDGEQVVAVGGTGGSGGAAVIFDRRGNEIRTLPAVRGWTYDVDIHPDGMRAAMGLHAGHLLLVHLGTGEIITDLRGHGGVPDGVRKVRFSPSGKRLASASDDESLIIWDVESREIVRRVDDKFDVNTVDWFPDETRVVFGTDKQVGIVTIDDTEAPIPRIDVGGVAEVRVFADGTRIAVGGSSKKGIVILDEELNIVDSLEQHNVARIRLSSDETQLFAASWEEDTGVSRWDLKTKERTRLPGHEDASVFAMDLDPRTGHPYAGGKHSTVVSWDEEGKPREEGGIGHTGEVVDLLVAGAGRKLYSISSEGSIARWSLDDMSSEASYAVEEKLRGDAVALSPDGKTVLATGYDGAVAFDVESGDELWRNQELKRSEIAHAIEGAFVVASDGNLVWLDAKTGEAIHSETVDEDTWLEHLLPAGDTRAIVAAYRKPTVHLWDLAARRCEKSVDLPERAEKAETYGIALGGGKLILSRWDRSFDLLTLPDLEHQFEATQLRPYAPLAVSPDGSLLAAGESELRLFDTEEFEIIGQASLGHAITSLAFVTPTRVVAGLKNGHVVAIDIE